MIDLEEHFGGRRAAVLALEGVAFEDLEAHALGDRFAVATFFCHSILSAQQFVELSRLVAESLYSSHLQLIKAY